MAKMFNTKIIGVKSTMAFLVAKKLEYRHKAKEGIKKAGRLIQKEVKT